MLVKGAPGHRHEMKLHVWQGMAVELGEGVCTPIEVTFIGGIIWVWQKLDPKQDI